MFIFLKLHNVTISVTRNTTCSWLQQFVELPVRFRQVKLQERKDE